MAINREDWVRSVVPSGTVIAFAGATPPMGWLLCNGSTISRAAYPALFTALSSGTLHGVGDGSTTFHLPNYSGRFLRGVANGSANDPDRAARTHPVTGAVVGDTVGSVQADQVLSHNHGTNFIRTGTYQGTLAAGSGLQLQLLPSDNIGGTETRPKNANVNYIIKA